MSFLFLQYDSPATLRRLVFDELKKFNYKKNGFVGAQGVYKNSLEGDNIFLLEEVAIFCSDSNVRNFFLVQSIGPHTYFGSPWYEFGNLQVRSRVILSNYLFLLNI